MSRLKQVLKTCTKPLIFGMVHVRALPRAPLNKLSLEEITEIAVNEAKCYAKYGLDGIIVENIHDIPFVQAYKITPETVACLTKICCEIRREIDRKIFMGIQILTGANEHALAVALACGLDFIRAECFVFSHVADEGFMNACAGELLRYRKSIGAENIAIFADVKKKHCSHSITSDLTVSEVAKAAMCFLSDGVILTGSGTGVPADAKELADVKSVVSDFPVLIGSGINKTNYKEFLPSQVLIVGSEFKKDGYWKNEVDENRINEFMEIVKQ